MVDEIAQDERTDGLVGILVGPYLLETAVQAEVLDVTDGEDIVGGLLPGISQDPGTVVFGKSYEYGGDPSPAPPASPAELNVAMWW
jgi:hypothetical protein